MSDHSSLQSEFEQLKKRVHRLERITGISETPQESSVKKVDHKPGNVSLFFAWLKDDWLMKLGAFLLILALAWFVRYAFINQWLGPVGRISLGLLAGAGIMAFGHFQIHKRAVPGQVLIVTGETMMLLTLYASQHYYQMFDSQVTLGMMVLVVIAVALLSVLHKSKGMAVTALLGGSIAPILASSGSDDYLNLLRYIFILDLGVLAVVTKTGWRFLTLLALVITGFYSLFFFDLQYLFSVQQVWIMMSLFFGLFFIANLTAIIKTGKATISDLLIAALNGFFLLVWIAEFVPDESASLVLSALTITMVAASSILLKKGLTAPLYIYSALGLVFLGAATAFELDGTALTIAFSLEAFAAIGLSSYVLNSPKATRWVSLVHLLPILMSFDSIDSWDWHNSDIGLFNEHFFVLLVVTLSLAGSAYILKTLKDQEEHPLVFQIMSSLGSIFAVVLVWLSAHKLFLDPDVARGIALVIYTLVGVGLLYYGTQVRKYAPRIAGGILLAGVVLRLLFVEVWEMALSGRIITFVAIGVLLIATAFFEKRIK